MQAALRQAPDNRPFRVTLARIQIAKDEPQQALDTLAPVEPTSDPADYDIHYISGLAYLELNERERARAAFEEAVAAEPSRDEARQELSKLEAVKN